MKITQVLSLIILVSLGNVSYAQRSIDENYYKKKAYEKTADSLYRSGAFRQAAMCYAKINRLQIDGQPVRSINANYNAACSWSRAGERDSAFDHLNALLKQHKFYQSDYITEDVDFISLHGDPRWTKFMRSVKRNARQHQVKVRRYTPDSTFNSTVVFYPTTARLNQIIRNDSLPMASMNHGAFRLYFRVDSISVETVEMVSRELTTAFNRINDGFKLGYTRGTNVILCHSLDEMKKLTGHAAFGGFALAGHDCLVLNVTDAKTVIPIAHELTHLMLLQTWGNTSRMMSEGSAVYMQNECSNVLENPINTIAAYLLNNDQFVPLESLLTKFDSRAKEAEVQTYFQSASFFKYFVERFGYEVTRNLWKEGFSNLEGLAQVDLATLEKDWKDYLRLVAEGDSEIIQKIFKCGCQTL